MEELFIKRIRPKVARLSGGILYEREIISYTLVKGQGALLLVGIVVMFLLLIVIRKHTNE